LLFFLAVKMRSLKIGRIFGITIELHPTFVWGALLLFLGMVLFSLAGFFPVESVFPTLLLVFFLFLSVFFHELVHSVVLLEKGFSVEKIILLPIGGISVSEELPEKPRDEFLVSVSGPLFNFFVAGAILLLSGLLGVPLGLEKLFLEADFFAVMGEPLLAIFYVNLMLGAFNLFFTPCRWMGGGLRAPFLPALWAGGGPLKRFQG
jgi:Zn-dependent protease